MVEGDHETRGEAAKRLLEREAKHNAGDAEARDERTHVHANPPKRYHEENCPARLRRNAAKERAKQCVHALRLAERLVKRLHEQLHHDAADNQYQGRHQHVHKKRYAVLCNPRHSLLHHGTAFRHLLAERAHNLRGRLSCNISHLRGDLRGYVGNRFNCVCHFCSPLVCGHAAFAV